MNFCYKLNCEWKIYTLKSIRTDPEPWVFIPISCSYFSKEGELFVEKWILDDHNISYEGDGISNKDLIKFWSFMENKIKQEINVDIEVEKEINQILFDLYCLSFSKEK